MCLPAEILHLILRNFTIRDITKHTLYLDRYWHAVSFEVIRNRHRSLYASTWLNYQLDYRDSRKTYIKLNKQSYDPERDVFVCTLHTFPDPTNEAAALLPIFQLNNGCVSTFDLDILVSFTDNDVEPFYVDWSYIKEKPLCHSVGGYFEFKVKFVTEQDVDMAKMKVYPWREKATIFDVYCPPPPDGRFFIITQVIIHAHHVSDLLEYEYEIDIDQAAKHPTLDDSTDDIYSIPSSP